MKRILCHVIAVASLGLTGVASGQLIPLAPSELVRRHAAEHVTVTGDRVGRTVHVRAVRAVAAKATPVEPDFVQLRGDYSFADGHAIGIDTFVNDAGKTVLLFSDYASGAVRQLYPVSADEYEGGPGFAVRSPSRFKIRFLLEKGQATRLVLRSADGRVETGVRIATVQKPVSFRSGDAVIRGTLTVPVAGTPVPAIILLHGSGPLTRSSFGPYPGFFVSLGYAVLTYDKRGSGESTGDYLPPDAYYPTPFVADAVAAIDFLKSQAEIDSARIGLWGSSEGGMVATQVAAQSNDVAFIINSSGFLMPLWQQMLFNRRAELLAEGYSAAEADEAVRYQDELFTVGRTGANWEQLQRDALRLRAAKWFPKWFETDPPTVDTLRWRWQHVYSFDPLPALAKVRCPALGLFGALDTSTPADVAAANMKRLLAKGDNEAVTVHIFARANHSLTTASTGAEDENARAAGLTPDVFPTLRNWLRLTVRQ